MLFKGIYKTDAILMRIYSLLTQPLASAALKTSRSDLRHSEIYFNLEHINTI